MKAQLSLKDFENLSAYLDGQLSPAETRRLEEQLKNDPAQRTALQEMETTRTLLRSAPRYRAPRNFTLTPEMARKNVRRSFFPALPALPAFRFSAAMSALSLIAVFLLELSGFLNAGRLSTASAPLAAPAMAPAATMAAAEKAVPSQGDQAQPEPTMVIEWQPIASGGYGGGSGGGSSPDQPLMNAKPAMGIGMGGGSGETANNPLTGPVTLPPNAVDSLAGSAVRSVSPQSTPAAAAAENAGNPILGLPSQDQAGKMITSSGELQDLPEISTTPIQERSTAVTVSPLGTNWLTPRRLVEVGLVFLAVLAGLGAFFFRRNAS